MTTLQTQTIRQRIANISPLSAGTLVMLLMALPLAACKQATTAIVPPKSSPTAAAFGLAASVQDLMHDMVDPSADAVWESVGTTITAKGVDDRRPKTEAEWQQVRAHAVLLLEATNLLAMDGRRLVPVGGKVLDEGHEGVLTAAEGEKRLNARRPEFVAFAHSLHDTAERMLAAIDAKDPNRMLEVGTEMDGVCESCHTTFWYPNQIYPSPSNGYTTLEALRKQSSKTKSTTAAHL